MNPWPLTPVRATINHDLFWISNAILFQEFSNNDLSYFSLLLRTRHLRCIYEVIENVNLNEGKQKAAPRDGYGVTFRSLVPAWCHSSPNSPPPRKLGTARTARKLSKKVIIAGLKNGVSDTVNPP